MICKYPTLNDYRELRVTGSIPVICPKDKSVTMIECQFCNTEYSPGSNHPCEGTGHWEEVDIGINEIEIWYCCHMCRDLDEPCETFFTRERFFELECC